MRQSAKYDASAEAHLVATRIYLTEVMGRPPTFPEIKAVWSTWLTYQENKSSELTHEDLLNQIPGEPKTSLE